MNQSVSPINQLLTCMRFYASASYLIVIGDISRMHMSTVSRIVVRVSEAIARLSVRYIKMPHGPEIAQTQRDFFEIAGLPRVIGAIDGTHVLLQNPGGEDGNIYRNRRDKLSINVQAVCESNLKFLDLVSRWPGLAQDSTIFNNSHIKARLEIGEFPNFLLLGDSGYRVRPYLFTLLRNHQTPAEQLYNKAHIRTRNSVERAFGVWKRQFSIVALGMRVKMQTRLTIIVATAVLHNVALEMHKELPPPPENIDPEELEVNIQDDQVHDLHHAEVVINERQDINNYFACL